MPISKGNQQTARIERLKERKRVIQAYHRPEDPSYIKVEGTAEELEEIEREIDWLTGKTMADFAGQNRKQVKAMTDLANENLKLGKTAARNGKISAGLAMISVLSALGAVTLGYLDLKGDSDWLKNQVKMHNDSQVSQEKMHSEQMQATSDLLLSIKASSLAQSQLMKKVAEFGEPRHQHSKVTDDIAKSVKKLGGQVEKLGAITPKNKK